MKQTMVYRTRCFQLITLLATLLSSCAVQVGSLSSQQTTSEGNKAELIASETEKQSNRTTIPISQFDTKELGTEGGLIAVDLDGDNQQEIVVTALGSIAAYSLADGLLWERSADLQLSYKTEYDGLPGTHSAGVQATDVDEDGEMEVLYMTRENTLEIVSGASGELKHRVSLPAVSSRFNRWEHGIVANFSGEGDRDILLQASQSTDRDDYIRDSVQAAFSLADLVANDADAQPLWKTDRFVSLSHGAARVADLNQDGRDEVVGASILGPTGKTLYQADVQNTSFPHIDSIAIDDIDPQRAGLEVVVPEESGRERVILFDEKGEIWSDRHRSRSDDEDGDKVSVGNFDPNSAGLEMWFRGNNSAHFTVLSARGELLADYRFADIKPQTWTEKGFEVIHCIRWTGEEKEYIVAKERHEAGDVGIFDALTGQLIAQYPAETERLYVADVVGDWREEIVVLEKGAIQVIENVAPNPDLERARLWEQPQYRRQKMTGNYYSP